VLSRCSRGEAATLSVSTLTERFTTATTFLQADLCLTRSSDLGNTVLQLALLKAARTVRPAISSPQHPPHKASLSVTDIVAGRLTPVWLARPRG
jgi:hypothetical protein